MAKKRTRPESEDLQRQSRKEVLRARKEAEQTKQIWLAVGGVAALLVLIFIVAMVNELIIAPNRAVATVNGEKIPIRQWEDRVRYERAQRIISLENQYEAFGGDVGIIQQFSRQTLQELLDEAALAESVLNQMADELIIRQEAEARGITVTDADVDKEIGSFFNFFNGQSPTPAPTPTETVMPTPSLTPIPTAVITDVVPTNTPFPTPTLGPTALPQPTATPVSQESFEEQLDDLLTQFHDYGVDEATFREVIRIQLYLRQLADVLAEESGMATEAEQASVFYMSFDKKEDANEALALIRASDFLTVWNTTRSTPPDPEAASTTTAAEVLWRTQDAYVSILGEQGAEIAFTLPPNVPSALIEQQVDGETTRYHIIQVSGREVRALPEATIQNAKTQLVRDLVDLKAAAGVELSELWRSRVPTQPVLDPKFLVQPTPAPAIPDAGNGTDDNVAPSDGQ